MLDAWAQILMAANAWRNQLAPQEEAGYQEELADWAEKHYLHLQQRQAAASSPSGTPPGARRGRCISPGALTVPYGPAPQWQVY